MIAVALPLILQNFLPPDPGGWNVTGVSWSLAAGAAGAVGALGIIYAFNFGGKPIFIMPLVFGFAPVVNTLTETVSKNLLGEVSPLFLGTSDRQRHRIRKGLEPPGDDDTRDRVLLSECR